MTTLDSKGLVRSRSARGAAVVLTLALVLALTGAGHTLHVSAGEVSAGEVSAAAGVTQAAVELAFVKAAVSDTVWVGTVTGDLEGVLTTVLIDADTSQPIWSVVFYWIVTAAEPDRSFVARLAGTLDSETGEVAMSGPVVEGYRVGAMVEERGQMFDVERAAFEGSILIHPEPARRETGLRPAGAQRDASDPCAPGRVTSRNAFGTVGERLLC